MSQPIKSIVNSSVFIRFHFFDFFMNFMISGTCLDFILDTFGVLGAPFGDFCGYCTGIEISMNFQDHSRHPKIRGCGQEVVKGVSPAALVD